MLAARKRSFSRSMSTSPPRCRGCMRQKCNCEGAASSAESPLPPSPASAEQPCTPTTHTPQKQALDERQQQTPDTTDSQCEMHNDQNESCIVQKEVEDIIDKESEQKVLQRKVDEIKKRANGIEDTENALAKYDGLIADLDSIFSSVRHNGNTTIVEQARHAVRITAQKAETKVLQRKVDEIKKRANDIEATENAVAECNSLLADLDSIFSSVQYDCNTTIVEQARHAVRITAQKAEARTLQQQVDKIRKEADDIMSSPEIETEDPSARYSNMALIQILVGRLERKLSNLQCERNSTIVAASKQAVVRLAQKAETEMLQQKVAEIEKQADAIEHGEGAAANLIARREYDNLIADLDSALADVKYDPNTIIVAQAKQAVLRKASPKRSTAQKVEHEVSMSLYQYGFLIAVFVLVYYIYCF